MVGSTRRRIRRVRVTLAGGALMETTDVTASLDGYVRELHLPTVRQCYADVACQARQESLSYERFLLELLEQECGVRQGHRIERRLRESHLPLEKSLANFDLTRLRACLKSAFVVQPT